MPPPDPTRAAAGGPPLGSPGASDEQFLTVATLQGELDLCFQTFGDPADEAMLLVMGLGGPMTWWDPAFCQMLADRGFHVIRYDNRDTGRSSRVGGRISRAGIVRSFLGQNGAAPYTLTDMAEDGLALLDHLEHDAAHVVGISMGGMIAQTMALHRPERVRSLTSIMSTTGRRSVGWQDPRLLPMLLARRAESREAYVAASARLWKVIGSPLYPDRAEGVEERAGQTWDRGVSASGVARQMSAILAQPDRTRSLRESRRADPGHPRHERQDGARVRRPGHLARGRGLGAAAGAGHGPRRADGAARDVRRRHRPDRGARLLTQAQSTSATSSSSASRR